MVMKDTYKMIMLPCPDTRTDVRGIMNKNSLIEIMIVDIH
jgi:hypothetical protein